ncbi:MAG: AzlD domain-containing protein [Moraxella sp.]|nr:AzlD domain-containing protein [Moraxella sp.]
MINENNFFILIIAIVAMVILTALSRILPFLLSEKSAIMRFFMAENSPIAPLGGAIIAAMTVVLALPFIQNNQGNAQMTAIVIGSAATVLATVRHMNTGLSVLIGMAAYFLVRFLGNYI